MVVHLTDDDARSDELLHALADPTRRDILWRVIEQEHSVTDLARRYPMSFAAVQKHVAVLERAGWVHKRRHGREQLVSGDREALRAVRRLLDGYEQLWRSHRAHGRDPRGGFTGHASGQGEERAMTVQTVEKDLANRTMVVTAEFAAPIDRVWQLWADPRKLERWWGPPTYPAQVTTHDLVAGGHVAYSMTGPEGDRHHGYWQVVTVDPPNGFEVLDGFADEHGQPNNALPTMQMRVALSQQGEVTRAVITSVFASVEAMQQVLDMGIEEGLRGAMSQMDAILAE